MRQGRCTCTEVIMQAPDRARNLGSVHILGKCGLEEQLASLAEELIT